MFDLVVEIKELGVLRCTFAYKGRPSKGEVKEGGAERVAISKLSIVRLSCDNCKREQGKEGDGVQRQSISDLSGFTYLLVP